MKTFEKPYREPAKPLRAGGRGGRGRPDGRAYARRRRAGKVAGGEVGALRQYWDEHAVKTGIGFFWLWFAAANWQGLQQATAQLFSVVMP